MAGRVPSMTSVSPFTICATSGAGSAGPAPPPSRLKSSHLEKNPATFDPKRVLVLTKITRYEFEKQKYPSLDDNELAVVVRSP